MSRVGLDREGGLHHEESPILRMASYAIHSRGQMNTISCLAGLACRSKMRQPHQINRCLAVEGCGFGCRLRWHSASAPDYK